MPLLRYCYVAALAVWVGGLAVAGMVVAPSVFAVLERADAANGRLLAGLVFADVLRRLHQVAYASLGVMFVSLTLHRLLGSRPIGYGIRASLLGVMLALMLTSGGVVSPRVEAIQREVKGSIAALPADDTRRAQFYRLHGYSNLLLAAAAAGGLVLLAWEARE
jgi:hypothetical protein